MYRSIDGFIAYAKFHGRNIDTDQSSNITTSSRTDCRTSPYLAQRKSTSLFLAFLRPKGSTQFRWKTRLITSPCTRALADCFEINWNETSRYFIVRRRTANERTNEDDEWLEIDLSDIDSLTCQSSTTLFREAWFTAGRTTVVLYLC